MIPRKSRNASRPTETNWKKYDADASASVAAVVTELGFAPVELGKLAQGGAALHVLDGQPGGLLFQNLVKVG
jgi:8-hydroxy-5-deazaflavin:NADPH oxidoreductase